MKGENSYNMVYLAFIHNRQQFTSIPNYLSDGQNSELNKVSHGLPQDFVLGPFYLLSLLSTKITYGDIPTWQSWVYSLLMIAAKISSLQTSHLRK